MFDHLQFVQARSAFEIVFDFDDSAIELSRYMKANPKAPKGPLVLAARQLLRVARQGSILAYAVVGGIKPEGTRTEQIEEATAYRKGMLAESVETARKALEAAGVKDAAPFMADARSRLLALELSALLHSDPCMEKAPQQGRQTCIGPHGDYRKSQEFAHWCSHYMREWCGEWCNFLEGAAPDRIIMAECLGLYAHLVKMQHRAGALVSGISTYWKWDNLDPFCKLLQAVELLTGTEGGEGTPGVFFALGLTWSDLSVKHAAYRAGTKRKDDAWLKTDGWVAWMMRMPNSKRCALPAVLPS